MLNIHFIRNNSICLFLVVFIFTISENSYSQCPDIFKCEGSDLVYAFFDYEYSEIPWVQGAPNPNSIFNVYIDENSSVNGEYFVHGIGWPNNTGFTGNLWPFLSLGCPTEYFPLAIVNIPSGETCLYEHGILCKDCPIPGNEDCEDFLQVCEDDLIDIIERNSNLTIDGCEQWGGECGTSSSIYRNGSVAIGIDELPPAGGLYKLYVRNGILTEQFKVAEYDPGAEEWGAITDSPYGTAWCDYVFEKNYPLMPLNEVDAFIQKNKRLPNTPSAKEVEEEGGFLLKETVLNHQEKIEELFLHLIELEKQLEEIGSDLENNKN